MTTTHTRTKRVTAAVGAIAATTAAPYCFSAPEPRKPSSTTFLRRANVAGATNLIRSPITPAFPASARR